MILRDFVRSSPYGGRVQKQARAEVSVQGSKPHQGLSQPVYRCYPVPDFNNSSVNQKKSIMSKVRTGGNPQSSLFIITPNQFFCFQFHRAPPDTYL